MKTVFRSFGPRAPLQFVQRRLDDVAAIFVAAVRRQREEFLADSVQVVGEGKHLPDIAGGVRDAAVAVFVQGDLQSRTFAVDGHRYEFIDDFP